MQNRPINQAMLAIQQAKLAIQQGLIYANREKFKLVENQLLDAQKAVMQEKAKVSMNEAQILEQANESIEKAIHLLHEGQKQANLQQG